MKFGFLFLILIIFSISYKQATASDKCLEATLALGIIRDIADVEMISIEDVFDKLCDYLPAELYEVCLKTVNHYAGDVIQYFMEEDNPDSVAQKLGLCKQPQCRLYPKGDQSHFGPQLDKKENKYTTKRAEKDPKLTKSIWELIKEEIDKIAKEHVPIVDLDNDHFVTYKTLRGSNWRGKDCNDVVSGIKPGTVPLNGDIDYDSNCNGISGRDSDGVSYEDKFCKDSQPMGVMVLGDSVGAHFHIPPEYFDSQKILDGVLKRTVMSLIEMEADWPHKSYGTGFDLSSSEVITGPVNSLYLEMWKRNRCNHRNYQNLAVNGMESKHIYKLLETTVNKGEQKQAYPTLTLLEIVGNDICAAKNVDDFITPEDFRKNVIAFLDQLDDTLAPGSKVLTVGFVMGSILYDTLHDHIHPIGHGITYAQLYEYLICVGASPCDIWLTTNNTNRNAADKHAQILNDVYIEIMKDYKPTNYEIAYLPFPLIQMREVFTKNGWDFAQALEAVDGFHPSQTGQYYLAKYLWENLNNEYPGFLPPENPYNEEIEKIFGDQGGF
ncbi:acyloxyacyl hydrolase [Anaeramoeba flamelloides]|uniref:Acyloxyacyl hydrolase n=1 Tax=Anaeramoeba flamelloides TaxID=1746091 RepID=A0AAV7ZM59_9EUKA|nr:acyloxyacyl hydrolase [Anaeramoeba flamelloides]|eukprot:Anaeramoba_flamelloidesc35168_g3_i1.p1 GENE.c35168_g3_i1~~c35168_g3_i1.p1  ORF type:complete len:561 (+),score=101.88 c35168_g3_i1:31-1683(+)